MELIFKSEQDKEIVKQVQTQPDATEVPAIDLGDTVVAFGAQVITNIVTTNPIKGIEDTKNADFKKLLVRSEFFYQPAQIELNLALGGVRWAFIYYVETNPYFRNADASDYRRIGNTTTMFETTISTTPIDALNMWVESVRYEVLTSEEATKKFNSLTPLLAGVYQWGQKAKYNKTTKEYSSIIIEYAYRLAKYTSVPAYPFINIQTPTPDAMLAGNLQKNLNYHSNQTRAEWEFTKAQGQQTALFNGDATANELQQNILSGNRIHSITSANGQIRDPLQPLVLTSNSLTMNQLIINGFEDKLLKYMFALRDSIASGTNKHNTEVATFNQIATDMANYKIKRFRNNQWTQCMLELVDPIIPLGANFEAELSLTDVEQNKVNTGNPLITGGLLDAEGNPIPQTTPTTPATK